MARFPESWRVEPLSPQHDRASFSSGRHEVDEWLRKRARQSQDKHLTSTHVLLDDRGAIAGYYTLAVGIVDFDQLPPEETRKLPRRALPVITLAWLGLRSDLQGCGLGERLLAEALAHCRRVRRDIEFVAVLIDALDAPTRAFYERFDFRPVPGHPFKLFISTGLLVAMVKR